MGLTVRSDDFSDGDYLDDEHAMSEDFGFGCAGDNVSPHLAWEGAPEGTTSFAVLCHDPDAPTGSGFWHWIVTGIPADVTELPTGAGSAGGELPEGALQVRVDTGAPGYAGPCPPQGDHPHRYNFTVHAVGPDGISAEENTPPAQIGFQLHFNALEKATIQGLYRRR